MPIANRYRRIAGLKRSFFELHVQGEPADLVGQHVKRGGGPGLQRVFSLDHRFVDLRATFDVVGLDRQQFLQDVSGPVGFERPDFHFAEALAAEAGLSAERLLGDQAVRPRRSGMDLVVDQVVKFQHVDVAHRRLLLHRFAGSAVDQTHLAVGGKSGIGQTLVDFRFGRPVEHRRDGLKAHLGTGPTEVSFQDLADVHSRGNAQRVEHDLNRRPVGQERHVFDRQNLGDHTLVAATSGHLVADADATFRGDVDLDHLQHAAAKLVATLHAVEPAVAGVQRIFDVRPLALVDLFGIRFLVVRFDLVQNVIETENVGPLGDELGILTVGQRRSGRVLQLRAGRFLQVADERFERARDFRVAFGFDLLEFLFELLPLVVAERHAAAELVRVDDDAFDARGDLQRIVFDVFTGPAEDRVQQFFFRRQFGLRLRRNLADQNVARLDVSPDLHDARFVQLGQSFIGNVGDVASELFAAQFGFANFDVEIFDVNRRVRVVTDQFLTDDDRVFVIETVERHEADQDVASECQFAVSRRGTVGDDLVLFDLVADRHQGLLVLTGPFVQTLVLFQLVVIAADFDPRRVGEGDFAGAAGADDHATVPGDLAFHSGADDRGFGHQQRNRLSLHVRTHQCAVRVVVLQERNQPGRHPDHLGRRDVHVIDLGR